MIMLHFSVPLAADIDAKPTADDGYRQVTVTGDSDADSDGDGGERR